MKSTIVDKDKTGVDGNPRFDTDTLEAQAGFYNGSQIKMNNIAKFTGAISDLQIAVCSLVAAVLAINF